MKRLCLLVILFVGVGLFAQDKPTSPSPVAPGVTRAQLEQRLKDLQAAKDRAVADVNAYGGAIQDVQYWIEQIAAQEKAAQESKAVAPKAAKSSQH